MTHASKSILEEKRVESNLRAIVQFTCVCSKGPLPSGSMVKIPEGFAVFLYASHDRSYIAVKEQNMTER